MTETDGTRTVLNVLGRLQADGGLRVEHLLSALSERFGCGFRAEIVRTAVYFAGDGPLPQNPSDPKKEVSSE